MQSQTLRTPRDLGPANVTGQQRLHYAKGKLRPPFQSSSQMFLRDAFGSSSISRSMSKSDNF